MILIDNLQKVRDDVKECARPITLIAATKTQSKEVIDEFASLAPDFVLGENRVQELLEKYDPRYRWHFIGRLQTNKVKYVVDKVELIHSFDREELAKEIEKQGCKHGKIVDCLVEINMGAEASKGGVAPELALDFIQSMKNYPHIRVKGVMSVLPNLNGDEKALGALCDKLRCIFEKAKSVASDNVDMQYLSCGMSADYKIALAHGANMIRIGRLIFGERDCKKDEMQN